MHRLTSSFILGYHGCDREVGERLLNGEKPKPSQNDYDWLGPGIYFWDANPLRGLQFAEEASRRKTSKIQAPAVVGAVIDLGWCLDLTTSDGIEWLKDAYEDLAEIVRKAGLDPPRNSKEGLRRNLDCAVIRHLHRILAEKGSNPIDTVKGMFTEGHPAYPGSGFDEKTHVQIAVCNPACIKAFFRVPDHQAKPLQ